jgi:hypothetical protein
MISVAITTAPTATVQNEIGVYKHLNGQTFPIAQVLGSGKAYGLLINGVITDFLAKNVIVNN